MRKLTGYIGAMVIVFALAGSVLLGFVLNVTNDPVVKDSYETITDVSGLYSYSQEETYIDYNPASNYINYYNQNTVYENTGLSMKRLNPGDTVTITTSGVNFNGTTYVLPNYNTPVFGCSYGYLYSIPGNPGIYWTSANGDYGVSSITFTWDGSTFTSVDNINTYSRPTSIAPFVYYPFSNYDAIGSEWANFYHYADETTNTQFIGLGSINPQYNSNNIFITGSYNWNTVRCIPYGQEVNPGFTPFYWDNDVNVDNGVKRGMSAVNFDYGGSGFHLWYVFGPRYVYSDGFGEIIDYTQSNRVNNYPVTNAYDNIISGIKPLSSSLTQSNYAVDIMMLGKDYYTSFQTPQPESDTGYEGNGRYYAFYHPYKTTLATILNTITLDNGTTSVTFTNKSNSYITTPAYNPGAFSDWGPEYHWGRVSTNAVWFANPDTPTNYTYNPNATWGVPANCTYINDWTGTYCNTENRTQQLIYDVSRGLVDFYANDVKIGTYLPSDITVLYGGSTIYTNNAMYMKNGQAIRNFTTGSYSFSPSITTNLYYTEYTSQPAVYLDPTEGIKIKSSNTVNVNWSNGYRNSDIQILFRIVNQGESYANDIIVGNDTVKVSSDGYRFSVQINNDTPVDIGNWRNIVLDLDVINGEVKALPVRTFNNFTNVRLYNDTDVYVGQLSDKQTVNNLAFSPTNKSFTFSIYNTKVFMDTYGVVMVDPSLNVTDYFTDLDGFYKIKMDKFSLVGNSITINGQTFDVINNKIRIENSDQKITDMDIFYKNGQCSVYFAESDTTISLGNVITNTISMTGNWYFTSVLYKGSEITDREYTWHIEDFVMNNGQFVVIYLGLLAVCYVAARKFCVFTVTDYLVMIASIIIALGVQMI